MITKPDISEAQLADLFTIESNVGFDRVPVDVRDIAVVAGAFTANPVSRTFSVSKPSPTSVLYQVDCGSDLTLMLRGATPETLSVLRAQCNVANRLPQGICIRPILMLDREDYVFSFKDMVWIAYRYHPGEIYDGETDRFESILENVFQLETALEIIGTELPESDLASLPRLHPDNEAWPELLDTLCAATPGPLTIGLGETARGLLRNNRVQIREAAKRSAARLNSAHLKLVHNDLNHANVIVASDGISFLDIEDIVFSVPEISIAHAIFKLLRHRVYKDQINLEVARRELAGVVKRLRRERWDLSSASLLFDYGVYRVLSDIELITTFVEKSDGAGLMYDLEKKIHNLFELWKIMEPAYEPATS